MQHQLISRSVIRFAASGQTSRGLLLGGVSAMALLLTAPAALAGGKPLAGMVGGSPATASINAAQQGAQQGAEALQRTRESLARSTQAIQAIQAAQAAARNLARNAPSPVTNGLAPGGLVPVANPLAVDRDPTGKQVWVGALQPTQTVGANGHVDVTVKQTQSKALLSWDSFNVGRNTTLTFDQQDASYTVLNRVVGNSAAPSQILGNINAKGTVLILNQNGIIFSGSSQINVGSLIATSSEVGTQSKYGTLVPLTLAQRNQMFMQYGLLGYGDSLGLNNSFAQTFAALPGNTSGDVKVEQGASIVTSGENGLIMLLAPHVVNAGQLSAPAGQILLASGSGITLARATGAADSADPNVRGLSVLRVGGDVGYVWNQAEGLLEASRGNITLVAGANGSRQVNINGEVVTLLVPGGAVINDGVLATTTSVSRNGSILINGGNIRLSAGSVMSIAADTGSETIPLDPTSLSNFKPSEIIIGSFNNSNIEMQSGALLYAPGANVSFNAAAGASGTGLNSYLNVVVPKVFIDSGAVIDVAGLKDVAIPASRNEVVISPVKGNELRDSPLYRASFLNGATVYLDPRLSGVRSDGVAWIGSPLIDAASYYYLVGVGAAELMTKGGSVTLGAATYNGAAAGAPVTGINAGSVIVKSGAVIDMSGGWVTYQAGQLRTTQLVTADGRVVDIGKADPNGIYRGIYGGFTVNHSHWGVSETFTDKIRSGSRYQAEYTEGRDAGTLTIKAATAAFDGTIYGQVYAGERQINDARTGTGKSAIYGDARAVQAASSELPAGGMLFIQADGGGADIAILHDPAKLPDSYGYGQSVVIGADGSYTPPVRDPGSVLPAPRLATIQISDGQIRDAGLSQVSLYSGGAVTVGAGTDVVLNPGGVFSAVAGRNIQIDGNVSAAGGKIALETYNGVGSIFAPGNPDSGSFDIVVNGTLDVAGRWVNDFSAVPGGFGGAAWLNGGSISMYAASRVLRLNVPPGSSSGQGVGDSSWGGVGYGTPAAAYTSTDISGSILINAGATLDLTGGGRIDQKGKFNLTAKGGNLALASDTGYYQIGPNDGILGASGFRVKNFNVGNIMVANPSEIKARIAIDANAIKAHGFGGGGTFTLVTPEFSFGTGTASVGTRLPMDFFSSAGFGTYNITSYKTDFSASKFNNGQGGYNAVLATQTLTVGNGETLSLVQSVLPSVLNATQADALRKLASGGDVLSVLSPIIPDNAWDSKAISLNLGGLLELHVAEGGSIIGAAGSALSASKLFNEGRIRLPGGTITQQEILPSLYASGFAANDLTIGVHQLSDIFTTAADGTVDVNALNAMGLKDSTGRVLTNNEVAGGYLQGAARPIYLLGILEQNQGVVLAPGSVTDLSGTVIVNPRAVATNGRPITDGRIVGGGTLASPIALRSLSDPIFRAQQNSYFARINPVAMRMPQTIVAQPGSTLDLSGAAGAFDRLTINDGPGLGQVGYTSTPVWSDAGSLLAANGATLAGAIIDAHGGAPQANGGTLQVLNPILTQHDPATPAANVISADLISSAGFDTLSAIGSLTSSGDVKLQLGRGFFLEGNVYGGVALTSNGVSADQFIPVVKSGGGILEIDARYIGINSVIDTISDPNIGSAGTGSVILKADAIDLTGAVIFDRSVANVSLEAKGDLRLNGVQQWRTSFIPSEIPSTFTLAGALAANGNVSLIAGQVYPTTGTAFTISSTAANGTISFGRSGAAVPPTPYSAGGNLAVYAANIVQGGVVRVPFGTLTLGSNAGYSKTVSSVTTNFAPATQNVTLLDGSVTGVSADGLIIPYGTTTDQKEWYFAPTGVSALSGPPAKVLSIGGSSIAINSGATVDLTGGGDVYAYEFIPGTGGSHDVIDRLNADPYSSNNGYQYPGGRQVYAIVPGLSSAPVAARDPIYSADYGNLYSNSGVGQRVYLDAAPGLAAGWYTLLPAKYAMLPGGMRVVEQTGASVVRGVNIQNPDGSVLVTGYYGDAVSGSYQSDIKQFSVESQSVFLQNSKIVLTSGSKIATAQAVTSGTLTPRLGVDAGQLILSPLASLRIDAVLSSSAAPGGRGSQVDIGGRNFDILSTLNGAPADGAIHLTADSLTNLNAGSLLIGGIRTDNTDGTTVLNITAQTILVANDAAHPLSAPEIILAVDDQIANSVASRITLADGAAIIATGTLTDQRSGNYVLDGRVTRTVQSDTSIRYTNPIITAEGALFRVANGPERLVQRLRDDQGPVVPAGSLVVGNITAKGSSIGLDTSGSVSLAANAALQAKSISLGAPAIAFTSAAAVPGTVILTPQLQALLSQGEHLTLHAQTSIGFDDGTYQFKSTTLDARNLVARQGGAVAIAADQLTLANSSGIAGVAAGGTGTLDIVADEISFGSGALATAGFGGVNLTGSQGVFTAGTGGVFDAGNASLKITTPYLGDRNITGRATEKGYDLTLKTGGTVLVTSAGTTALDPAKIAGVPGSGIAILGNGITISGTHLRATAGALSVKSTANLVLANGAWLEAPGYSRTFGDSADAVVRAAPGGVLTLVAQGAGGLDLGDGKLSVGGGSGNGGRLSLSTPNGAVNFGTATLDGAGGAGNSGGVFAIDTKGSLDLVALNTQVGALGFTGGFDVRTRSGDIVLAAGQVLKSGAVKLTAEDGFVTVGGSIDTSGVNGGDIVLYGTHGVTLQGSARLDATATGYAADDTRQARAGNVTLGTDFIPGTTTIGSDGKVTGTSGAISLALGASIDVSAKRAGDRLIRLMRNGVTFYQYVAADQGGTVNFRAPVFLDGGNHQTVNVAVASAASIVGASSVAVEGFRRWDLAAVANSGSYTGVTLDTTTNTVTLDVRTGLDTANVDGTLTPVAGVNFLGDNALGTVVDYVQNFDISSAYAGLGGLASLANFHARAGVDLDTTGNIVLASNWNLGAGTVNLTAAVAAGNMTLNPALQTSGDPTSGYVAVAGREGEILANNTRLTYRTGGSVSGEAGIVALRAGGSLDLKGSLTDGFFLFRDQTNETYLNKLGLTFSNYKLALNGGFNTGNGLTALTQWSAWTGAANPAIYLGLSVSSTSSGYLAGTSLGAITTMSAPYSAIGNSPAALGSFVADSTGNINGGGDPLASAVVFPLLPNGAAVSSWSYSLVAGAAGLAGGSVPKASIDPSRVDPASSASLIVEGRTSYKSPGGASSVGSAVPGIGVDTNATFGLTTKPAAGATVSSFNDWLTYISGTNFTGVSDTSVAVLYIGVTNANPASATDPNRALILGLFTSFAASRGMVQDSTNPAVGWRLSSPTATLANTQYIAMSVANFKAFVAQVLVPNQAQIEANLLTKLTVPTQTVAAGTIAHTITSVRTGTGNISMAASGDIDLRGTPAITYIDTRTDVVGIAPVSGTENGRQLGGVAVYTAGRIADPTIKTVTDPVTGVAVTIDPTAALPTTSVFSTAQDYTYGRTSGVPGIMVADPLYLEGGGNVSVAAGNDLLGRRDLVLQALITNFGSRGIPPWIGTVDQPWRIGSIGNATRVAINPQLFREGLGALGGGSILVSAGRDVSDISTVADTSLLTATATPASGLPTSALLAFGGGNVVIDSGRDILGGRLDVGSGIAQLSAGRDIGDAASMVTGIHIQTYFLADGTSVGRFEQQLKTNELRVRISDATADIEARGSISLQGVAALGASSPNSTDSTLSITGRDNRYGFYSAYSGLNLLANGSITVTNDGSTNLSGTPYYDLSMYTYNGQVNVYPGSLTAASIASDINIVSGAGGPGGVLAPILMVPSAVGQLKLFAAGNIAPTVIAMLDSDPGLLPGLFSTYVNDGSIVSAGIPFAFPTVLSSTSDYVLSTQHNTVLTHLNDPEPVYLYAGNDIGTAARGVTLSVPKQARIDAGRDIVNMLFLGQNLTEDDVTRVVAGRDITATAKLTQPLDGFLHPVGIAQPAMQGNTFVIGGPGDFFLEAGRNLGPFLNSSVSLNQYVANVGGIQQVIKTLETYGGGIMSVGNQWNPYLATTGADINVMFGVGKGADYAALRDAYVAPGSAANALGDYGSKLVAWMQKNAAEALLTSYGTTAVSATDAYAVFVTLPQLRQRMFLIDEVYFNELRATADKNSVSYLKYSRGYAVVNTLFPASLGYTANSLEGGASDTAIVSTGDLDLRLATIETMYGGNINILGPGGRVLAGSVVSTSQQAARRTYDGARLFSGTSGVFGVPALVQKIPAGFEGVLTLRGGSINTFTDGDFLLNQSRLFTEQGGDILMWSSNADLNAGQGPKTSANFPPIVVHVDQNGRVSVDALGGVTGAGIATLKSTPDAPESDVYLIAPRGTVDAGDAGVRVSGNISVAARFVLNSDNFKVGGTSIGIPTITTPDVGGMAAASNTVTPKTVEIAPKANSDQPSIIIVEFLGFGGPSGDDAGGKPSGESEEEKKKQRR